MSGSDARVILITVDSGYSAKLIPSPRWHSRMRMAPHHAAQCESSRDRGAPCGAVRGDSGRKCDARARRGVTQRASVEITPCEEFLP